MKSYKRYTLAATGIMAAGFLLASVSAPAYATVDHVKMVGTTPAYQIGKYDSHNRFCYDGSCKIDGSGRVKIDLDPGSNSGIIVATFKGSDGTWKIVQKKFKKIATDVNLHGATGGDVNMSMSPPVIPQVWTYVATWGPAKVYHNGKLAWMGPAHLMVTEEVRDPATGKVDFKGPKNVKDYPGSVYNKHGIQIHYVAHPMGKKTPGYLPPYKKFVHLMWEKVIWE